MGKINMEELNNITVLSPKGKVNTIPISNIKTVNLERDTLIIRTFDNKIINAWYGFEWQAEYMKRKIMLEVARERMEGERE